MVDKSLDFFLKIGGKIRQERRKKNITQGELAKSVGVNSSVMLAKYEKGEIRIPVNVLLRIANFFETSIIGFLDFSDDKNIDISLIPYVGGHDYDNFKDIAKVNIYSYIGAGEFVDFSQDMPISSIFIPKDFYTKKMVAIKVKGESMEPTIKENSYVGIDVTDKEYIAGKIYAVFIPDEGIIFKRVFLSDEKIILKSDNSMFSDIEIFKENINIEKFLIGRARWIMQKI